MCFHTIEPARVLEVTREYNPQVYACDLENLLTESGVDLLYGTVVCGAAVTNGRITHIIVENKSGRSAIGVKTVVDATGDADDITTQVLLSHKTAFEDFLKKGTLCENYSLAALPSIPQVRMTRRINGESTMSRFQVFLPYRCRL